MDPQRRQALFTFADARGNNPHGTSEDAVHEAQRLNAQRYETVDQMNARLDARRPLGESPAPVARPMTAGEALGMVIGLGLIGAAAYALLSDSKKPTASGPQPGDIIETKVTTTESPAPMLALPAPVQNPVPVAKRARRRRSAKVSPAQQPVEQAAKPPAP